MAVHSREMTRVIQDGNTIYGYDRYYKETEAGNESTQRIASNDRAIEVGYYKFASIQPDGTLEMDVASFKYCS